MFGGRPLRNNLIIIDKVGIIICIYYIVMSIIFFTWKKCNRMMKYFPFDSLDGLPIQMIGLLLIIILHFLNHRIKNPFHYFYS